MAKILVTGSKGQLGFELTKLAADNSNQFFFTDIEELDITSKDAVIDFCNSKGIEIIINAAAYTAVDKAETEQSKAELVNSTAVSNLVDACLSQNRILIHVSTDYVFDGKSHIPYKEDDITSPTGVYGKTKLNGEKIILEKLNNAVIIRTSWLYSSHGNNFVKTMIRVGKEQGKLRVITDQVGTPTYALDLASAILAITEQIKVKTPDKTEIYHYSNEGVASWYDFAKAIIEISDIYCNVTPIETYEYPTPAQRPSYSILNKRKIKEHFNISIPYWRDSLIKVLDILNKNKN